MSEKIDDILLDAEEKMDKAIVVAREDFATIRAGRATVAMFNKVMVEYYGTFTPVNQLALAVYGAEVTAGGYIIRAQFKINTKRFERTPAEIQRPPAHTGQHTDEILSEWLGADAERITALRTAGTVA